MASRSNFLLVLGGDCAKSVGGSFCKQSFYSICLWLAAPLRVAGRFGFSFYISSNLSSEDMYV